MEFGEINSVDLRDIWPGEATHFTPWLADHINFLADKLGMDLQLESTEVSAGNFSADIVARDLSSNKLVVVENQFGTTDHRHLGQLITYSSVLGAGVVVWIAEKIRSEHKTAIDFLNHNIRDSLQIFAIEVSVVRIDDSKPAFILNVVSRPPESSVVLNENTQQSSETREKYRLYFQGLIDELREVHKFTNARMGQPQNWYTFSSDNSRVFKYSTAFAQRGRVRVEVYLDCGDKDGNERAFDWLYQHKSEIEGAFGESLVWERLDTKQACRIATYRDGDIDADSESLAEIKEWVIKNLLKMKAVFPRFIHQAIS